MFNQTPAGSRKLTRPVYHPYCAHRSNDRTHILRIANENGFTRIDFIHYFQREFWDALGPLLRINPRGFIRDSRNQNRLMLVKAVNAPMGKKDYKMPDGIDCLIYTLYFPELPPDTTFIDIIDTEKAGVFPNFLCVSVSLSVPRSLPSNN